MSEGEMNFENQESLPEQKIRQAFTDCGVNFDFTAHPKIMERLIDIGEHFQDAVEMTKIVSMVWDRSEFAQEFPELQKYPKEKMMLATLVHDIGKSGPDNASPELKSVISRLFPHDSVKGVGANDTIDDFAKKAGIKNYLAVKQLPGQDPNINLNTSQEKIRDFWGRHSEWTYDILSSEFKETENEDIIVIASAHHFIDNRIPKELRGKDTPKSAHMVEVADKYHEEYQLLTMVDKLQAAMKRGHAEFHAKAIEYLRNTVERCSLDAGIKATYVKFIDKFAVCGPEIGEIIKQPDKI